MERKEFLKKIGLGVVLISCTNCLISCGEKDELAPEDVDFTLNLNDSSNVALTRDGGSLYKEGVLVARISAGNFIALSQRCPHQGTRVELRGNKINCPNHNSNFNLDGSLINGPATKGLFKYNTELNGDNLRVFS